MPNEMNDFIKLFSFRLLKQNVPDIVIKFTMSDTASVNFVTFVANLDCM